MIRYTFTSEEYELLIALKMVYHNLEMLKKACKTNPTMLDDDLMVLCEQITDLEGRARETIEEV